MHLKEGKAHELQFLGVFLITKRKDSIGNQNYHIAVTISRNRVVLAIIPIFSSVSELR